MKPPINPIQTRYAGCHFRSRLEARWAVFFDALGIPWEYEPEGYEVTDRLGICNEDSWWYLPDFWLPDNQLWVEVKGSLDDTSMRKVLSTAACLSAPRGGCNNRCYNPDGYDTLLLGPIPKINRSEFGESSEFPSLLHLHKGDLILSAWPVGDPCSGTGIANDDAVDNSVHTTPTALLRGWGAAHSVLGGPGDRDLINAYTAARSARFEHGESG